MRSVAGKSGGRKGKERGSVVKVKMTNPSAPRVESVLHEKMKFGALQPTNEIPPPNPPPPLPNRPNVPPEKMAKLDFARFEHESLGRDNRREWLGVVVKSLSGSDARRYMRKYANLVDAKQQAQQGYNSPHPNIEGRMREDSPPLSGGGGVRRRNKSKRKKTKSKGKKTKSRRKQKSKRRY